MRSEVAIIGALLTGISLVACTALAENAGLPSLVRYEAGSAIPLSAHRSAMFATDGGYAEIVEAGRVFRLSALDFETTHALVGDVTGDGVNELLIEVLPSRSGSCYELWAQAKSGFSRHDDLFCNPILTADGFLSSNERDGPYTRVTEYAVDGDGPLQWVRRQEPLSPNFARLVRRAKNGSTETAIIFLGLPECGEATVTVRQPVAVAGTPAAIGGQALTGRLRIMDVSADQSGDQKVRVQASDGASGWLPSSGLGDLEAAAQEQCGSTRGVDRRGSPT